MAFSEIEMYKIDNFVGTLCKLRAPEAVRDKLRYEYQIKNQDVILYEIRP